MVLKWTADPLLIRAQPKRRWLTFSVRTLLISVTLLCAWLSYQLNWIEQRRSVASQHHLVAHMLAPPTGKFSFALPRPDAPWPLRWLGVDGYVAVIVEPGVPEPELNRIQKLFPEATAVRD